MWYISYWEVLILLESYNITCVHHINATTIGIFPSTTTGLKMLFAPSPSARKTGCTQVPNSPSFKPCWEPPNWTTWIPLPGSRTPWKNFQLGRTPDWTNCFRWPIQWQSTTHPLPVLLKPDRGNRACRLPDAYVGLNWLISDRNESALALFIWVP